MPSEVDKLFEETKQDSIMDQPLNELETKVEDKVEDDELGEAKRRRERRLMEKLQAEREANIAMSARLEAITEAQKFRQDSEPSEYLKSVERIYGTNSPEAQEATELLKNALKGVEERATERALEKFREEQAQAQQAVQEEEQRLDSFVEEIENSYNVTFTPTMEKSFFQLMEKLSPKDPEGNIVHYADPHTTWEILQERLSKQTDTRAKDLASRAMTPSGSSNDSKIQDDATQRYLREIGIL